jgi:hypothetical protein
MFTPGRQNAPQAAVTLAKIFEQPGNNWADRADIVLDWENSLLESPDKELQYPVMLIACSKHVPGKGFLVVQSRLNIDNVFLGDYVTHETLADIVEELRIMTLGKLEEAGVI